MGASVDRFYTSPNCIDWTYSGEFGEGKGSHEGVWECPDLFPLKVRNTDETKWVLIVNVNPGAPAGGSGTQYFVGEFNGRCFETDQEVTLWMDYGKDNYAGVTWNNAPDDRRILIGWMNNWQYANEVPNKYGITLKNSKGEYYTVGYDNIDRCFYADRTRATGENFSSSFPSLHFAPYIVREPEITWRMIIDVSSVELFAADGKALPKLALKAMPLRPSGMIRWATKF